MSVEFSVSVDAINGGNAAYPNGEWICRQDEFCSYVPPSLTGWSMSQFADYNGFAEWLPTDTLNWSKETMIVLEDGSAKYGQPVCPTSNCEAVIFYDDYMFRSSAFCPIGTEMELRLTGTINVGPTFTRCVTPAADVILSGDLPEDCNLVNGQYCCPQSNLNVLKFVHKSAPCQPGAGQACIYPQAGRAYGQCGALGSCVRNLEAADVVQQVLSVPTRSPTRAPISTPAPISPPPTNSGCFDGKKTSVPSLIILSFIFPFCINKFFT